MAKICWVIPKVKSSKFTGGIYCILRHADELARMGHTVKVVPLQHSEEPKWFGSREFEICIPGKISAAQCIYKAVRRKNTIESLIHAATAGLIALEPRAFSFPVRHSAMCERALAFLPDADITIATSFETALPVALHGKGVLAYYAQHFEPFFSNEFDDHKFAKEVAKLTYRLPLNIISNSVWLRDTIFSETGASVHSVAGNAIAEEMFSGERKTIEKSPLRVISYGGRGAIWKGFSDMAEGIGKARSKGVEIDWSVYGDCELPPENSIAPFKRLGFLSSDQLSLAYKKNHVLLSSSWYESFPLFPLEAMASGLAVITTKPGTEAFAKHMETAWVVPPRNPDALCEALVELDRNHDLRERLGAVAMMEAQKHTWPLASRKMEGILLDLIK